jgi:hypothetical protein
MTSIVSLRAYTPDLAPHVGAVTSPMVKSIALLGAAVGAVLGYTMRGSASAIGALGVGAIFGAAAGAAAGVVADRAIV